MKTTTICFAVVLGIFSLFSAFLSVSAEQGALLMSNRDAGALSPEEFAAPPDDFRPWCYYWWLKGNVTPESITQDLSEMRDKGFGGLLLFDSRGYHEDAENHIPVPLSIKNEFMSDSWRALFAHLLREADRLGLKVSVNISDTGGHLRGPWNFGDEGPRRLVWSEGNFNGPKPITLALETVQNQPFYHDAALLAVRVDVEPRPERETVRLGEKWSPVETPAENAAVALETVDLTPFVQGQTLTWEIPEGAWKILRFGSSVTGDTGSIDILNEKIVEKYFHRMAGTLLDDAGPLAGRVLTHFYNVSWEGSEPDWTDGFDRFFAEKRGYDLFPYFSVLRGLTVKNPETSRAFLTDFHKTIADAFRERCYRPIGALCHERGVGWHSENGGPWNRKSPMFAEADMLTFWGENDFPQGEFWVGEEKPLSQSNTRFAANAARIYGRDRIAVEAFTHMTRHWTIAPRTLKPSADRNYIDGANHFIWHTFTASPPEAGKPGLEYFAGTHINANVTWQPEAAGFITYLARCQYLLRRGAFVADLAVYASDRNQMNWGRGEKWSASATLSPPAGYAYDLLDTPSFVERLDWCDGLYRLRAPDGSEAGTYRLLILDPAGEELPLAALEKIAALAEAGGTVLLGGRPEGLRGLSDSAQKEADGAQKEADASERAAALITSLWGEEGASETVPFGAGRLVRGKKVETFLAEEGLLPDFVGPFEYHHRKLVNGDLYFIAGSGKGEAIFRAIGETVELWDAVNGRVFAPDSLERREDGRTKISLDLPENGSIFVRFLRGNQSSIKSLPNAGTVRIIAEPFPKYGAAKEITGPWRVAFDEKLGGPGETLFETLTPWNENEQPGIRYYSGTAVYRTTFALSETEYVALKEKERVSLSLGAVREIARIHLNGVDGGALWTAPWRTEFASDALKVGENELEIAVTNVWANRLIGDAALPPEERLTKTNVQYFAAGAKHRPHQGFGPDEALRPSGLLGPVTLAPLENAHHPAAHDSAAMDSAAMDSVAKDCTINDSTPIDSGPSERLAKQEIIDALSELIKEPETRELPNLLDYADRTETVQRDGKEYCVWNRAISAALEEKGGVWIPVSEQPYYIDRPIVMASGDYLRADSQARIYALPGMKTCMVRNQHIVPGRAVPLDAAAEPDTDLTITGGIWSQESTVRNETNGVSDAENPIPGTAGILLFSNVRRVSITHLKIEKGAPFAVHLSNAADIYVSDVTVETNCDGVHLNGPLTRAVVEKIVCERTGDDCIALNAWDWPWSAPTCGPMSMILVQDCRTLGQALKDIRLLAGVLIYPDGKTLDCPIRNVVLRNLDGFNYFKLYAQAPPSMPESCRVGTLDGVYFDTIRTPLTGTIQSSWTENYYGGTAKSCGSAAPFSILSNGGVLSFENLTIATPPNADGSPCIFYVGPESANTNDPEKPLDIFMSDADAAVGTIALANIVGADGQPYPNPEKLVKEVRLSVNPDFPQSRPRGGVGSGIVERVIVE